MKKILGHTWKAVSYNLGNLLLFEIGYRILTFFLAMQMIDHAIDFSRLEPSPSGKTPDPNRS